MKTDPLSRASQAKRSRTLAWALTSAAVTALATPAFAQTATVPAAAGDYVVDDVIVTARRREERIQDIPASVAALGGEALRETGVRTLRDLTSQISGFTYTGFGGGLPLVSIRGDSNRLGLTEPGTGFFYDGIYLNRLSQLGVAPIDAARVEVLKGPQSTLYGKNTTAGAINIISNDPTWEWEGRAEAGIGTGAHKDEMIWHAEGYISGPIVADKIAFRLAGARQKREGYVVSRDNRFRGMGYNAEYVRAKLLINLTDDVRWELSGQYRRDNAPRFEGLTTGPGTVSAFQQRPGTGTATLGPTIWDRGGDIKPFSIARSTLLISELSVDSAFGTVTSLTSYQMSRSKTQFDEGTEFPIFAIRGKDYNNAFSQEFRLAGSGGGFTWLGGVYYLDDMAKEAFQNTQFLPSSAGFPTGLGRQLFNFPTGGETAAVFGQVGYDFNDRLNVTGGLRYSYDRRERSYSFDTFTTAEVVRPGGFAITRMAKSFEAVTGNIVASYKLAPDVLTYASFSTGTKQGGFSNGTNPTVASLPYKQQEVEAYELGVKSDIFGRKVRLNVAGFYNDYSNLQIAQAAVIILPGGISSVANITANAGSARAYGVDVDATAAITQSLKLEVAYTYMDAIIQKYNFAPGIVLRDVRQTRSPKHSGRVGLTYEAPIMDGNFTLNGNVVFKSRFVNDINFTGGILYQAPEPGYHTFNMSASYEFGDGYTVSAYVNNIANKQYYLAKAIFTPTSFYNGVPGEPRTFEISVSKQF